MSSSDMLDLAVLCVWLGNLGVLVLAAGFSSPFRAHNED